jgi:hypothetical protein
MSEDSFLAGLHRLGKSIICRLTQWITFDVCVKSTCEALIGLIEVEIRSQYFLQPLYWLVVVCVLAIEGGQIRRNTLTSEIMASFVAGLFFFGVCIKDC